MKPNKRCRGTHKDTSGLGCDELVDAVNRKLGLGRECLCYSKFLLNTDAGRNRLNNATLKATKPRRDLEQAGIEKKARTSLGALKQQTQLLFNKYIRLRDAGLPCISSNTPYKDDFDAGHCFPVKQFDGLRFDYDNVHGQSIGDNRFKEGNHSEYLINLPNRIGEHRTRLLIIKAETYKRDGYRFTRSELLEIQEDVKRKIKDLKAKEDFVRITVSTN